MVLQESNRGFQLEAVSEVRNKGLSGTIELSVDVMSTVCFEKRDLCYKVIISTETEKLVKRIEKKMRWRKDLHVLSWLLTVKADPNRLPGVFTLVSRSPQQPKAKSKTRKDTKIACLVAGFFHCIYYHTEPPLDWWVRPYLTIRP